MEELVFLLQLKAAFRINETESEFDTIQKMYRLAHAIEKKFLQVWSKGEDNIGEMTQKSNRLRLEGNKLVTGKKQKRNLLAACRLYTEAIFAAPNGSEALALAHFKRAFALLEFGYIQQAYDDCVCAREQGYPEHLMDKILLRQADCARKLEDAVLLKRHLDELNAMPLNDAFMKKCSELHASLDELLKKSESNRQDEKVVMPLNRETQKIVKSSRSNDRYMIAAQAIQEEELVFPEEAVCFVPINGHRICHECGTTQLIPFPCMSCHGKVLYCSLKCRKAHAAIHEFECLAYQRNVWGSSEKLNIAFRMVVKGLPQLVPLLGQLTSAKALWTKLMDGDSSIGQSEGLEYVQSLQRATSSIDMYLKRLIAEWCYATTLHLQKFTIFFDFVKNTAASQRDWQIITAALMLRLSCQTRGYEKYFSLTLAGSDPSNFFLFTDHFWVRPFRVQLGNLHKLTKICCVARASFPYTSLATHSCVPAMRLKFAGLRYISTFAAKNIEPGEEISKCYIVHHKNRKFSDRSAVLKEYNLVCKCVKCKSPNPDKDYAKYNRYRCERLECRKMFIKMPENDDDVWWDAATRGVPSRLKCNICGVLQTCDWYKKFLFSLSLAKEPSARHLLFLQFDGLTNWLVDYNEAKLFLAQQMIGFCFDAHFDGFTLTDLEFGMLAEVVKFLLLGMADQEGFNSMHYVSKFPFLWDLIALGKYKCSNDEMLAMQKAIDVLPNEYQAIFMNYYDDYLKPLRTL